MKCFNVSYNIIFKYTYLEEFSCVLITIIYSNGSATNADIEADSEVSGLEWHLGAVLFENHLSLEEGALRGSAVYHLWLGDHHGPVLQEIVNDQLSDSVVF